MNKTYLQDIIHKYHLEGIIENAEWKIKENNNIEIPIVSQDKDMYGVIKTQLNIDTIDPINFVVYDTSKLLKLLSITDENVDFSFNTRDKKVTKMMLVDGTYTLEYVLADLNLAPSLPKSINEPDYEITFDVTKDLVSRFIKARKSLETNTVSISPTQNQSLLFTIGELGDYNNKIKFEHPAKYQDLAIKNMIFPLEYIKNIFINNTTGNGFLSIDGLLKLQFDENNIQSEYYLITR